MKLQFALCLISGFYFSLAVTAEVVTLNSIPLQFGKGNVNVEDFRFGVGYGLREVNDSYPKGVEQTKVILSWGTIEPCPNFQRPVKRSTPLTSHDLFYQERLFSCVADASSKHHYYWGEADPYIFNHFRNGFNYIQVYLLTQNKWFVDQEKVKEAKFSMFAGAPLLSQHYGDFQLFIAALVKRYEPFGLDSIEIESEVFHRGFWTGSVDEYLTTLELAYSEVHRNSSRVKVVLSGLNFGDFFDDLPSMSAVIPRYLSTTNKELKDGLAFQLEILKAKNIYDEIEFHYIHGYQTPVKLMEYLRSINPNATIWGGDTLAGPSPRHFYNPPVYGEQVQSKLDSLCQGFRLFPCEPLREMFRNLCDPAVGIPCTAGNQKQETAKEAQELIQASAVTKKVVTAMASGVAGVNVENIADWHKYANPDPAFIFQGLSSLSGRKKPAYHVYNRIIAALKQCQSISEPNVTQIKNWGVWAFRLSCSDGTKVIAWSDYKQRASISVPINAVRATSLFSSSASFSSTSLKASNGRFEGELGEVPVLIEY